MDLDSKAEFLEDIIVSTAKQCFKRKLYPPKIKNQMKLPKAAKDKLAELNATRQSCAQVEIRVGKGDESLRTELASLKEKRRLQVEEVQAMIAQVKAKQTQRVRRLNLKATTDSKQFWNLA